MDDPVRVELTDLFNDHETFNQKMIVTSGRIIGVSTVIDPDYFLTNEQDERIALIHMFAYRHQGKNVEIRGRFMKFPKGSPSYKQDAEPIENYSIVIREIKEI